jgi:hypothetical protein
MTKSILKLSLLAALFGGTAFFGWYGFACAQSESRAPGPVQGSQRSKIVGFLETRDFRIAMKAGGFYTVLAKGGKVVAENVTLKQLQASNPGVHAVLERAIAASARNNDARGFRAQRSGVGVGVQTLSGTEYPLR